MERTRCGETEGIRRLNDAAIKGNVASLRQVLDEHPLLLNQIIVDCCDYETPLHVAAMFGHIGFAREILIQNNELALKTDDKGRSPLHLASAKGDIEMVKLLSTKVEPSRICELRDGLGRTALHIAALKSRDEVLLELLRASPGSTRLLTNRWETILHFALKPGQLNTLKLLVANVDNVAELLNSKDIEGNTILHILVANKQTEMVKYLVGEIEGTDINVRNNHGCTPLDGLLQASHCAHPDIFDHDWMNNMRSALMVVASLIGTVAFQAALTPPGGIWQDTDQSNHPPAYYAGQSILAFYYPLPYRIYVIANTTAFISSISIILLLISGSNVIRKWFAWLLMTIMWMAILSMATTYMAALLAMEHNNGELFGRLQIDLADRITMYTIGGFVLVVTIIVLVNIWLVRKRFRPQNARIVYSNSANGLTTQWLELG